MATTVGRAEVQIVADTRGFARDAERDINRALRNVDTTGGTRRISQRVERETRFGFRRAAVTAVEQFGVVLQGGISRRAAGVFGISVLSAITPVLATAGTLAAGAFILGFGGTLSGLAIAAAAQSEEIQETFSELVEGIVEDFTEISQPFEATLLRIAELTREVFEDFLAPLEEGFATAAPAVTAFAEDLADGFRALALTIVPVLDSFSTLLSDLGPALANDVFPNLAEAIKNVADTIAANSELFTSLLTFFLNLASGTLNFLATLTEITAWFAENPERIRNALIGIGIAISLLSGPVGTVIGILTTLGGIAVTNADDISSVFSTLRESFAPVAEALQPIIDRFGEFGETVRSILVPFIEILFNQINNNLAPALASLVTTLQPIVDLILSFVETALPPLAAAFTELVIIIINSIIPAIEQLVTFLAPFLSFVITIASALLTALLPAIVAAANVIFNRILPAVLELLEALRPLIEFILNTLVPIVVQAFDTIADVIEGAVDIILGIIDVFIGIFTNDWDRVWDGILRITRGAGRILRALVDLLFDILKGIFDLGVDLLLAAWDALWDLIQSAARLGWERARQIFRDAITGLLTLLGNLLDDVLSFFGGLPGDIANELSGLPITLFNAGREAIGELIDGLLSQVGRIDDIIGDIAGRITSFWPFSPAERGPLRMHPPEEWGRNIGSLLTRGLLDSLPDITNAGDAMATRVGNGPARAANQFDVRVFVGDRELTDIVDLQIDNRRIMDNIGALAGAGAAE